MCAYCSSCIADSLPLCFQGIPAVPTHGRQPVRCLLTLRKTEKMVGFGGVRACRGVHVWSGAACKQGASLCTHGLRRAGGSLRSARAPPRWTNASPKPVPVSVAPRAADSAACAPLPQFSGLHKEQTPDPCAVAGIFGCNAGAMTHAARGGAGYVNINGYKVLRGLAVLHAAASRVLSAWRSAGRGEGTCTPAGIPLRGRPRQTLPRVPLPPIIAQADRAPHARTLAPRGGPGARGMHRIACSRIFLALPLPHSIVFTGSRWWATPPIPIVSLPSRSQLGGEI